MLDGTVLLSLNLQLFVTPILFILVDISVSSPQINRVLVCAKWKFTHEVTSRTESLSFTYTANGKRQIKFDISQNRRWTDKNSSRQFLWFKKLRETTNLCVELMNSKRQVKGELGHVVQICVLPFDVNVMH